MPLKESISEPHPGVFHLSALFSDARPLIYEPSISSGGRGVERAGHLVLNALRSLHRIHERL